MDNIKIIGNKIYWRGVLVAELVNTCTHTIQGEFVDYITKPCDEYEDYDFDDEEANA